MKLSVISQTILAFPILIFATCGEPIRTADMPKPATAAPDATRIPKPEKADLASEVKESDTLARNVFTEEVKEEPKLSGDILMEVQTSFQEFDLGDDPMSDQYNLPNLPTVGE